MLDLHVVPANTALFTTTDDHITNSVASGDPRQKSVEESKEKFFISSFIMFPRPLNNPNPNKLRTVDLVLKCISILQLKQYLGCHAKKGKYGSLNFILFYSYIMAPIKITPSLPKKKEKTIESPTNIRTKCYCAHSTKEQYDVEKKNLIDKTTKTFLGRVQTATQKG